jgi:enamine deaminase RidA (YjgF/YER057c/UK114 family)
MTQWYFHRTKLAVECRVMKIKLLRWLGREFVEIVGEGKAGVSPEKAVNELFKRFEAELQLHGLSLDNTARIRVWGKDRDARTLATAARSKVLSGKRRAASSSFISAEWFDSDASAGLELLAMRPLDGAAARNPVDFEPARNYLCYLEYDRCFFFSGFTSEAASLEKQAVEVLATISVALARARTDWDQVVKLSVLLQRGHDLGIARRALAGAANIPEIEFSFVDGFAGEKYLLEIEATAVRE